MENSVLKNLAKRSLCLLFITTMVSTVCVAKTSWQSISAANEFIEWELVRDQAKHVQSDDKNVSSDNVVFEQPYFVTKEAFSNFILELEFKVDEQLKSGIQIRASKTGVKNNNISGYYIDLDPVNKRDTGTIWALSAEQNTEQNTQGLPLYPQAASSETQSVLQPQAWQHIRIEAIEKSIRVWVNRIMVANLVDDGAAKGFISLQSISSNNAVIENVKTHWRNIRIQSENLLANTWPVNPNVREISYLVNELTANEKQLGYRLLWDGKTYNGWRDVKTGTISSADWQIENDQLRVLPQKNPAHEGPPGGLITAALFGDFELELEFKIGQGQNGGIKYYVDPQLVNEKGLGMGIEYQLLDDKNSPYATMGTNGNRTLASAIDLFAPKPLTRPDVEVRSLFRGVGTWNKARIVSRNGIVEHWLNNEKVVEFDRHSPLFEALVKRSMHSKWPNYGMIERGHILLQDFDGDVSYRSIKIREF